MSLKRGREPDDPLEQTPRSDGPLPSQVIGNITVASNSQVLTGIFNMSPDDRKPQNPQEVFQKKVDNCRDTLLLTDPDDDRATLVSAKGKRTSGTCEWIRGNKTYQSWLGGDAQPLWISGGPGKGKTVLSIFLTEELERLCYDSGSITLLFYFCNQQDERQNNAMAILRGLVYQLLTKHPNLATHAMPSFRSEKNTQNTLASVHPLWRIFHNILRDPSLGTVYCVIDGLDECDVESTRQLVQYFTDLFSPGSSEITNMTLKLVIVSRPGMVELNDFPQIRLDPDNDGYVNSDIELFVSAGVGKLSEKIKGFDNIFRTHVHDTILSRAEGTFLWAGFVMDELCKKRTCTEIQETLETIPKGLRAIFDRMMHQIRSNQRHKTLLIFHWVTFAVRPLTLEELAVVTGIQPSPPITAKQATYDEVDLCGPFLEVHENKVNFVHQSAKDYLLQMVHDGHPQFYIKPEEAHLQLARTCLDLVKAGYLKYGNKCNGTFMDRNLTSLDYAMQHWADHARCASISVIGLLDQSRPSFQGESIIWSFQTTRYPIIRWCEIGNSLLAISSFFGIIPWIEKLLGESSCQTTIDAIMAATENMNISIVHLLLDHGVNINGCNSNGWTALTYAAAEGHTAIVRLLLDRGADINAFDGDGWTALITAAFYGEITIVELLLDCGADINACDGDDWTALLAAASNRNAAIVQLLLGRGADILPDNNGETALMRASKKGKKEVVALLLDCGADMNIKNCKGDMALTLAMRNNHTVVVRMLLTHQCRPNYKEEAGNTSVRV
ncbi:putative NACHT and Ankyrin domain protein [Rosellinia necatrix]|uniref:Putative NACHT and Ankyrin domain protein n=1 Tax=Rosellinia necatrix TaxID=77044 RepID=A0A1W2TIU9_ROSNE|nr:putative NACHT and Ankyrin domain protein [Rosellinia necatrix]